jgi:4-amino-4-deoxy-L-arabinose transferase-like glycosyltransferase
VSQKHFEPLSGGRSRIDWGIAIIMFTVFAGGLVWFTHGNKNPAFYNPEEMVRVSQVISGEWDYHRPVLFELTISIMKQLFHVSGDVQSVAELGRVVSAFYSVASIVCLSLAVYFLCNRAAAVLLACLLLFQHAFFDLAHTVSENTSLMFGAALCLLAMVLLERKATVSRALFLGCSVAIAASAQYIGLLLFVPALVVVVRCGNRELRGPRIAEFVLGLLFAMLVLNFSAITKLPVTMMDLVQNLMSAMASLPGGLSNLVKGYYWALLLQNTTPAIWIMFGLAICIFWFQRSKLKVSEIALLAIPTVYFLLLLFSPPESDLHFLPMIGFTYAFAVVGSALMGEIIAKMREQARGWLLPALIALCLSACFSEFVRGLRYFVAFSRDDRLDMLAWMDGNLDPGCKVIADRTAFLPGLLAETNQKCRFELVSGEIKPTGGKVPLLAQLVASGVSYAALSDSDYDRFFSQVASVAQANDTSFSALKQFYFEVLSKGILIWRRERGTVKYMQPGLAVYRLPRAQRGEVLAPPGKPISVCR